MRVNLLPRSDDAEILRVIRRARRREDPNEILGWMTNLYLRAVDNDDPRMRHWEGYLDSEDWLRDLSSKQYDRVSSILSQYVSLLRKGGERPARAFEIRWYAQALKANERDRVRRRRRSTR